MPFDDHFRLVEDLRGVGGDCRAGAPVVFVAGADAGAGIAFHQGLMTVVGNFTNALRRQADTVFVVLNLSGYTNQHDDSSQIFDRQRALAGAFLDVATAVQTP